MKEAPYSKEAVTHADTGFGIKSALRPKSIHVAYRRNEKYCKTKVILRAIYTSNTSDEEHAAPPVRKNDGQNVLPIEARFKE